MTTTAEAEITQTIVEGVTEIATKTRPVNFNKTTKSSSNNKKDNIKHVKIPITNDKFDDATDITVTQASTTIVENKNTIIKTTRYKYSHKQCN